MIGGALVASFVGFALMNPANADHVDGVAYAGNADCDSIAPDGVTWDEFKIDNGPTAANSPYKPGGELEITISNASSQGFDWSSNFDMAAVLVKGGPLGDQEGGGGVRYEYLADEDMSDKGLHALPHAINQGEYHGISHVSFCYLAGTVVTSTSATTPTTASPPITAAVTPAAEETPAAVAPAAEELKTTVLGDTLVAGDTLPRTGAAATNTLALAGGLGLAFGLMMLMLARRKTAIHSS
jgi:LPXTG-motif cell wall-anchored protein